MCAVRTMYDRGKAGSKATLGCGKMSEKSGFVYKLGEQRGLIGVFTRP